MRRVLLICVLALAGLTLLPVSAGAAVTTCTQVAGTLTIDYDAGSAQVSVQRSGDAIKVFDGAPGVAEVACVGAPTVNNVGNVNITDMGAGHNSTVLLSEQGGTFTPGTPAEVTGASEIEIIVTAGDGNDRLSVDGTDNADNHLFGETVGGLLGANLNGDDDGDDVVADVEELDANGRKGDDTLSAVGNAAIPAIANPLTLPLVQLAGGNQNDTLRGGAGADMLVGGTQDDDLNGGGGNDTQLGEDDNDSFAANAGGDSIDGGAGNSDIALFTDRTSSVNVTIDGAANDGGSEDGFADNVLATTENVKSGPGADFLTGSIGVNELTGNAGNDTVDGAGGNDKVSGSAGLDRVLGNSGNDNLFGGSENDNLVGASGNDKLTGNSGKDFMLGKKGIDRLIAKDGTKDKKIDCGKGSNKKESFTRDSKDPKPKSC